VLSQNDKLESVHSITVLTVEERHGYLDILAALYDSAIS